MKIPTIPKIIIQSILGPLISVFLVSRFNLFDFITFVPEEHRFEVGLTLYLAFVEAFWKYIDWIIERNSASVRCTFFVKEAEKDIENTPAVSCSVGVATIKCEIALSGSAMSLRGSTIKITLPSWLSSQCDSRNKLLKCENHTVSLLIDSLIPRNNQKTVSSSMVIDIPLIQDADEGLLKNLLLPEIDSTWLKKCRIRFATNGFKISNKEVYNA